MGAEYEEDRCVCTEADLPMRYNAIVRECLYESGHGGYTGTFAEKPELKVRTPGKVWELEAAKKDCQESNPKWDESWAYDLGQAADSSPGVREWYIGGWCSS